MTYKLFLDDIRQPPDDSWIVVRSYQEAVDYVINTGFPHTISFDHDLSTEHYANDYSTEKTGKDFANWIIEHDLDHNTMPNNFQFFVHSANPAGAANIRGILTNYMKFKNKED